MKQSQHSKYINNMIIIIQTENPGMRSFQELQGHLSLRADDGVPGLTEKHSMDPGITQGSYLCSENVHHLEKRTMPVFTSQHIPQARVLSAEVERR